MAEDPRITMRKIKEGIFKTYVVSSYSVFMGSTFFLLALLVQMQFLGTRPQLGIDPFVPIEILWLVSSLPYGFYLVLKKFLGHLTTPELMVSFGVGLLFSGLLLAIVSPSLYLRWDGNIAFQWATRTLTPFFGYVAFIGLFMLIIGLLWKRK